MDADVRPPVQRRSVSPDSVQDEDAAGLEMFQEPKDFRPATPPPSEAQFAYPDGSDRVVPLRLLGSHPLWGHMLWNAATVVSEYMIEEPFASTIPLREKNVLELGAAAGLPSVVAHWQGARVVVSTDYPDADLVDNLRYNCQRNVRSTAGKLVVEGYLWGADATPLLKHLSNGSNGGGERGPMFDLVILADLIFNHYAHAHMLDTLDKCLPATDDAPRQVGHDHDDRPPFAGPQALVFFSHHRPHKAEKDMNFFTLARERGWTCVKLGQWKRAPMFAVDHGPEEVRSTIHGWQVYR